jgi:hypothetical protein
MNPRTNTFGQPIGRTPPGWPTLEAALRAWLDPVKFAAEGRQRVNLAGIRASQRSSS